MQANFGFFKGCTCSSRFGIQNPGTSGCMGGLANLSGNFFFSYCHSTQNAPKGYALV
jgi:hypothetical protein